MTSINFHDDSKTLVISVMGAMGNGKSSLLNAIGGEQVFQTGRAINPITTHVEGVVRPWRNPPLNRFVRLIDTPGMCDSSARDRRNVQEMVKYFRSLSHGVSAFILVFNINDTRLDAYTQNMLHLFERLLTRDFWNHVIVVFTHVDEDHRDLLEDNIEVLEDPSEGFCAEIARVFGLPFVPPIVFLTNKNVKFSSYAHACLQKLYDEIIRRETATGGKFTCGWFKRIIETPTEEGKSGFILDSIKQAVASLTGRSNSSSNSNAGGSWCPIM